MLNPEVVRAIVTEQRVFFELVLLFSIYKIIRIWITPTKPTLTTFERIQLSMAKARHYSNMIDKQQHK